MMKRPWQGLADLIEDTRYSTMGLRRWISPENMRRMSEAPRILVDAGKLAQAELQEQLDSEDRREMEEAEFLIGQFEEAVVFLSSLEIV